MRGRQPFASRKKPLRNVAGVTKLEVATILAIVLIACVIAMPFVIEMREAAREAQCAQNLKTIGIAMHTFAVSDPEERFLSGPLSPLTDGYPDLYGWPADMVLTGTGKAHELRCPPIPLVRPRRCRSCCWRTFEHRRPLWIGGARVFVTRCRLWGRPLHRLCSVTGR